MPVDDLVGALRIAKGNYPTINNIPTYRLSIIAGVSSAGCVRLVAVVAVIVS